MLTCVYFACFQSAAATAKLAEERAAAAVKLEEERAAAAANASAKSNAFLEQSAKRLCLLASILLIFRARPQRQS